MDEELYGEDFNATPDADITHFLLSEGCDYNPAGVVCPKKSKNRNCAKCGWNPRVEKRRIAQIRKRMREYVY